MQKYLCNILQSVIIGKKGWGLWVSQWTDGIVDWSFTKEEILKEFELRDIEIPESLMIEWDKLILKRKIIRNENYIKSKQSENILGFFYYIKFFTYFCKN